MTTLAELHRASVEEAAQFPHPLFQHIPVGAYGDGQAVEATGTVAAPLLAGFGLTSGMVVIQEPGSLKWPAATLALLVAATVVLVMVVQYSFWARRYWAHYSEALTWWPDHADGHRPSEVEADVARQMIVYKTWANRVRAGYDLGIFLLLAALDSAVWPSGSDQGHDWGPVPAVLVSLGLVYEVVWMVAKRRSADKHESSGLRYRWDCLAWRIAPQDPRKAPVRTVAERAGKEGGEGGSG